MQSQMFGFRTKILNFECLLIHYEQYACLQSIHKEDNHDDHHGHRLHFC